MKYEDNYREAKTDQEYLVGLVGGEVIRTIAYSTSEGWIHFRQLTAAGPDVGDWYDIPITSVSYIVTKTVTAREEKKDPFYPQGTDW